MQGSGELTRGLDIVPSLRENLRRLGEALEELAPGSVAPSALETLEERPATVPTVGGELRLVAEPWGTRGYDDLRIRVNRENLGRGLRPRSPRRST